MFGMPPDQNHALFGGLLSVKEAFAMPKSHPPNPPTDGPLPLANGGRRAVPVLRQHGPSAHPPATARSPAELRTPGISLSLRASWLRVGRHPPTEMVRQRSVPPPLSPLSWMARGHWPPALVSSVYLSHRRKA
jgi:hypothetical protein